MTKKSWKTSIPPNLAQNEVGQGRELRGQLCLHPASTPRGHGSARVARDCCSAKARFAMKRVAPGAARRGMLRHKNPFATHVAPMWRSRSPRRPCIRSGAPLFTRALHYSLGRYIIHPGAQITGSGGHIYLTKLWLERGRGAKHCQTVLFILSIPSDCFPIVYPPGDF